MSAATPDPVAQIGRDIARVWQQIREFDDGPSLPEHEYWRQEYGFGDRLDALEAMAVELPAQSLAGAMVAIILAHNEAEYLPELDGGPAAAKFRTVSKLLYSALAVLEEATGSQREELAGDAYMRRDLDPHAIGLADA